MLLDSVVNSLEANLCYAFAFAYASSFLLAEEITRKILSDSYATERFRVIGPLQNSPDFAKDFNCSQSSPMNRQNKCIIWWKRIPYRNSKSVGNGKKICLTTERVAGKKVFVTFCAVRNWKKNQFQTNKALWKRFVTLIITDVPTDSIWHWFCTFFMRAGKTFSFRSFILDFQFE